MIIKLLRLAAYLVAAVGVLLTAVALISRLIPVTDHNILFVVSYSPYLLIGSAIAALVLLVTRRWLTAAIAVTLTAAAVAAELPLFIATTPAPATTPVRVLSANVRVGQADPRALIELAATNADVVAVQELTPGLADTLDKSGITDTFPYQALDPGEYGHGVGIWSRYPITKSSHIEGYRLKAIRSDIAVPGTSGDTVFVNIHLPGPWPQPIDAWREEIDRLPTTLGEITDQAGGRPVVVAGDFNSTYDMAPFRKLLTGGYRDGAEQAGAGLIRTFPADGSGPPRFGIDHVLTYNATAADVHTIRIPGSDHLGLLATVYLPRGG